MSNQSGGWLDCSATGTPMPTIDWISWPDSTSVGDVPALRKVLRNGTLALLPFSAEKYRQDIHNTIYRCSASNSIGRIISKDVQVRAGEFKYHFSVFLIIENFDEFLRIFLFSLTADLFWVQFICTSNCESTRMFYEYWYVFLSVYNNQFCLNLHFFFRKAQKQN